MINSEDGSKLKIEFFSRIRDSLKMRLEEYKIKDNKGSDNKIDFLDDWRMIARFDEYITYKQKFKSNPHVFRTRASSWSLAF